MVYSASFQLFLNGSSLKNDDVTDNSTNTQDCPSITKKKPQNEMLLTVVAIGASTPQWNRNKLGGAWTALVNALMDSFQMGPVI